MARAVACFKAPQASITASANLPFNSCLLSSMLTCHLECLLGDQVRSPAAWGAPPLLREYLNGLHSRSRIQQYNVWKIKATHLSKDIPSVLLRSSKQRSKPTHSYLRKDNPLCLSRNGRLRSIIRRNNQAPVDGLETSTDQRAMNQRCFYGNGIDLQGRQ